MFIVRRQDEYRGGGASYLVEGTRTRAKYRWGKTQRNDARRFISRSTAKRWASRMGGDVVTVAV